MKEYIYTSPNLDGSMIFKYRDGFIVGFELTGVLTDKQALWLQRQFPFYEQGLDVLKKQKTATLIEKKIEITFDIFYDRYDVKRNKVRAKKFWNKLPEAEKTRAYYYINTYKTGLSNGIQAKYPDTYLGNQIWND